MTHLSWWLSVLFCCLALFSRRPLSSSLTHSFAFHLTCVCLSMCESAFLPPCSSRSFSLAHSVTLPACRSFFVCSKSLYSFSSVKVWIDWITKSLFLSLPTWGKGNFSASTFITATKWVNDRERTDRDRDRKTRKERNLENSSTPEHLVQFSLFRCQEEK